MSSFSNVGWQFGDSPEVSAQMVSVATNQPGSASTTAAIDTRLAGVHDLVLRTYTPGSDQPPFFQYNPDASQNGSILPNQSIYVVWEVATSP